MRRTIIVSNRLPVQIKLHGKEFSIKSSIGGLATGLRSVHQASDSIWLGWCGIESEQLDRKTQKQIETELTSKYKCAPVFLTHDEVDCYYNAFSNKTLWPLFHYFPMYTEYHQEYWHGYKDVNQKFFKKLKRIIKPNDRIWVHDYHLLLLPQMIREAFPNTQIGFFLHIPFPSFEIFRLLPWREQILEGMLGSDLVGFHTYDYARHFLSSVQRALQLDANLGTINLEKRKVHVDVFPMGIDYEKHSKALELDSVKHQIRKFRKNLGKLRIILSVDRLDYTKGIPNRLHAFDKFLDLYPEWKEKTALILIVAPSRIDVPSYMVLKTELDALVSQINSKHGTIGWTPITYFFRTFSFKGLSALYGLSDILLVTPLRDGMNLVVKEYLAVRKDNLGVVIISETTGASGEMGESILVNANNIEEMADALNHALNIPPDEQKRANKLIKIRIKQNNVDHWAADFLDKLASVSQAQTDLKIKKMTTAVQVNLITEFAAARKRLLLLDYDGTLVSFKKKPELASPDKELKDLLKALGENKNTELVIISGRDRDVLSNWLGDLPIHLVGSHGIWIYEHGHKWRLIEKVDFKWKEIIRPILEFYCHRTPGSLVEEKSYSLAWHYRNCDPDFATIRLSELKAALMDLTSNMNIGILEGSKVLEIKNTAINKGRAASLWIEKTEPDFILAIGDDWTDEDTFEALPETGHAIKVGYGQTGAQYTIEDTVEVRKLLGKLAG
ncbi:bifunctional alpha,alpha-trehalose-phosphate synthase (UDP-forming)/trehalose-phosphatase [candidate division KSB1 bacterium]|nr:bifunctional alpha,alpha-trehalose-phosphate synthase (UDP-forming)/trehalose-phosphatase [candidate division KSB1 bacterium]